MEELRSQTGNWDSSEISINRKLLPSLPWLEGHRKEVMLSEPRSQDHPELLWASLLGSRSIEEMRLLLELPHKKRGRMYSGVFLLPLLQLLVHQCLPLSAHGCQSSHLGVWKQSRGVSYPAMESRAGERGLYLRTNRPEIGPARHLAFRNTVQFLCIFKSNLLSYN